MRVEYEKIYAIENYHTGEIKLFSNCDVAESFLEDENQFNYSNPWPIRIIVENQDD